MRPAVSERAVVFLIGAVQFINILDFVMVMPLGPDFATALGIPTAHIGYIGGSYTAAASVSGLVSALFLDRFDRRKALACAMFGLVVGTLAGGFATGLYTLMAARILAGIFGGPATSLSLSIIADVIPPERRGKAMGAVMGAFSVASVIGVPAGLELARQGSWRMPFFAVAALGLVITTASIFFLPPLRIHLENKRNEPEPSFGSFFKNPTTLLALWMSATLMMSNFVLIPNISAYVQFNLGYPRERLGLLYLVGGTVSFFMLRLVGRLVDRFGSLRVGAVGTAFNIITVYLGFFAYRPSIPVLAIFISFFIANSTRNVPNSALASKVPSPLERARFMSIQSAVQHMASAVGAFISSQMLAERDDHVLVGIDRVAMTSMCLSLLFPVLLGLVEARVKARGAAAAPRAAASPAV